MRQPEDDPGRPGAAEETPDAVGNTSPADSRSTERRTLPFILPSATLAAFLLLIVAILASTVVEHPALYSVLTGHGKASVGSGNQCLRAAMARIGGTDAAMRLWTSGHHIPGAEACKRTSGHDDQTAAFLLALATLAAVTASQYWFRSTRRARRRGVVPITSERFPELHGELVRLAGRAVPRTRIRFLIDLLDPGASGVAFGRVRRRHVLLGRGVIGLRTDDPDAFRALVLHELAHLRNRDLDLTIVTLSFVRAYLILVFAPSMLGALLPLAFGVEWRLNLAVTAQLLGIAALLILARGAVLRNREFQADARVVQWQNGSEPLARILVLNAVGMAGSPGRPRARRRMAELGLVHPTPRSRVMALDDPAPLMYPGFGFAFILGVCLVLSWDPSDSPTALMTVGRVRDFWSPEPFTVILVMALGLAVLRAALHAELTDRPLRLMALRCGLALGVGAGTVLSPSILVTPMILPGVPAGIEAANTLVLAGMAWLLVIWLEFLAESWAGALWPTGRPWWLGLFPVAAVAAVVLACARPLFGLHWQYLYAAHDTGQPWGRLPGPLLVLTWANSIAVDEYLSDVPWLLCGVALLLVPTAAGRLLGRRTQGQVKAPREVPRVRVRWAVCAAVLAFAAVTLSIDWYGRMLTGRPAMLLAPPAVLSASCAAAGAAVAACRPPYPVLSAMAVATTVGVAGGFQVYGSLPSHRSTLVFLTYGLETALAAALLVRALAHCARRGRAVRPWAALSSDPGRA